MGYSIGPHSYEAPSLPPGLYLVATPIGNLRDVTIRALETLSAAETIYCEDTRVTAKLLERYGIRRPLKACHDHSEAELAPAIAARAQDHAIAFVSDAGTPLVSDPGYRLVQACIAANVLVIAIPGASATLPALQLAGMATDSFHFIGFLPSKLGERRSVLLSHSTSKATIVAFESPARMVDTLADMADIFGDREIAIARELTKMHEEVLRGNAAELSARLSTRSDLRGECVLVIAPAPETAMDEDQVARILADAAKALPASKAAAQAAKLTGLSRDEAFRRILALKER